MMLRRLIAVALLVFAACAPARAASSVVMPTSGPMSFSDFNAAHLNPALLSLLQCNFGNTPPTNGPGNAAAPWQCWVDTSTNPRAVKLHDGSQFVTVFTIDSSAHSSSVTISELINTQSGSSYPIVDGDRNKLIVLSNSGAVAATIGQAGASGLFQSGWPVEIKYTGTATATITPATSTIDGASSLALAPGQGLRLISDGTNYTTWRGMQVPATTCATHQWVNFFSATGVPTCQQQAFSDLSGSIACAQYAALTGNVTTSAGSCTTTIGANVVTNAMLAQPATGATLKMNATSSAATLTDTKVSALTDIATPHTTLDWIPIEDHVAGTIKKVNPAELVSAVGGGVTSVTAGSGLGGGIITSTGTITAPSVMPQGRLTLQSGAPVMTASQAAKGTVFYDCGEQGGTVPRFTGSVDTFDTISSCEVSATMVSAASAGQIVSGQVYDWWWVNGNICAAMSASTGGGGGWAFDTTSDAAHTGNTHTSTLIDNLSTNVIKFGWMPGMTIAGSGIPGATTIVSIGSDGLSVVISAATTTTLTANTLTVTGGTNVLRGFSYTQIDRVTRPYATNRNSLTNCFTGATNRGPVAANQGTYLGTFFATANGQTSFVFGSSATGGGQAASLYVWNMYNRRDVKTSVSDSATSWTIVDALVHSFHDDAGTRLNFVIGLAEDGIAINLSDEVCGNNAVGYPIMAIGFALDRSGNTTFDHLSLQYENSAAVAAGNPVACTTLGVNSTYTGLLGAHFVQALANQDGQATSWTGTYMGGIRTSFDGNFRM